MQLFQFFLIAIAGYSLMHWVFIPAIERQSISEKDLKKMIAKRVTASTLASVEFLFLMAGIACIILLLIYGVVLLVSKGHTSEEIRSAIEVSRQIAASLSVFSGILALTILIVLIVTVIYLSRKKIRDHYLLSYEKIYSDKFEHLKKKFEEGEWEDIPADEVMNKAYARLDELQRDRVTLSQQRISEEIDEKEYAKADSKISEEEKDLTRNLIIYDIERRIDISTQEVSDYRKVIFGKNLIGNQQLLGLFERTGKLTYIISLFLLFVSLLGVSSRALGSAISERRIEMEELLIARSKEEAKQSWETVKQSSASDNAFQFSEEDEELIDYLSEIFEKETLEELLADEMTEPVSRMASSTIRSFSIRDQILSKATNTTAGGGTRVRANAVSIEKNTSYRTSNSVNDLHKDLLGIVENDPNTSFRGKTVKSEFKKVIINELKNKPTLWNEIKPKIISHKASAQYASEITSVSRKVVSSVAGNAIDASGFRIAGNYGELGNTIDNLVKEAGVESLGEYYKARSYEFLTDVNSEVNLDNAVSKFKNSGDSKMFIREDARVKILDLKNSIPEADLVGELRRKPPSINISSVANRTGNAPVLTNQLRAATGASGEGLLQVAESLSSFGDFFSPQPGHSSSTVKGKSLTRWDAAKYGRHSKYVSSSFRRSRSFVRLRGFSRIGGVLIGHENEYRNSEEALDFVDFSWRIINDAVFFDLTPRHGESVTLGPFKKSGINHALTYAADGRPIAVTMVTSYPLKELKILLHPALVDSRLGCRVIEVDRFVDQYTGSTIARDDEQTRVSSLTAIYAITRAARLSALVEEIMESGQYNEEVATLAASVYQDLNNASRLASAEKVITEFQSMFREPNILREKSEFFDRETVNWIATTAGSSSDIDGYIQSIKYMQKLSSSENDSWMNPVPEYQFWSGVRERTFKLDKELNFLKYSSSGRLSSSSPLEFMLQVAFTTAPPSVGEDEDYYDEEPYEFKSIAPHIMNSIDHNMSPYHRSVLKDVEEFTILQRLFRVAFNGGFGDDFPLEKLPVLMDETMEGVRFTNTQRWNSRPGQLELEMYSIISYFRNNLSDDLSGSRADILRSSLDRSYEYLYSIIGYSPDLLSFLSDSRIQDISNTLNQISPAIWDANVSLGVDDTYFEENGYLAQSSDDFSLYSSLQTQMKITSIAKKLRKEYEVDSSTYQECESTM